jgi:putative transposase
MGCAMVRRVSNQLSPTPGNDAGARRRGRSFDAEPMGSQVCPTLGRAIPCAQTSDWVELANGRDLGTDQGRLEVSVSRGRQGRRHGRLPVDGQTGSQGLRFLRRAIGQNGRPKKITIDKSGANTAAIESYNKDREAGIEIRQVKYLNNIVEQDHRAVKRLVRPMLGFKSFRSAHVTLTGIELMHMIRKGQLQTIGELRPAQAFYSLAA